MSSITPDLVAALTLFATQTHLAFTGALAKIDMTQRKVVKRLKLSRGGMPQDIRVTPDGKRFLIADMMAEAKSRSSELIAQGEKLKSETVDAAKAEAKAVQADRHKSAQVSAKLAFSDRKP